MRQLIAPLIRGIPATTHGPPGAPIPLVAPAQDAISLVLPAANAGLEDTIYDDPLTSTARAAYSINIGAGNLGETGDATDFGALDDLIAAGRGSATAVSAIA